ncbi:MAG: hypothetical protein AAB620_02500 [Patescibacteria group bacterium]|mgnify:CR=1 FL=1
MSQLSQSTQKLIQRYQSWYNAKQPKDGVSTLHVDEVASRVASFYEKVREVVDWREEHLMRRTAIGRVLKRRLFLKGNGENVAESLLLELIRNGHFPNDRIEETKVSETQKIIEKYIYILNHSQTNEEKLKIQLYNWILEIAACEIEKTLSRPIKERALIRYMTEIMLEKIKVSGLDEQDRKTQIYIAVQKALFKLDPALISYSLLKEQFSEWADPSSEILQEIAEHIYEIWEQIERDLNHPLAERFYHICEKYDTPYLLLGDIIADNPKDAAEKIAKPSALEALVRRAYEQRLKTLKSRLRRAAIYSTVSIFLTKIAVLIALEIPLTKYTSGRLQYFALGIDVLVPTLLMILLVATIKYPPKENLTYVTAETMKIVYQAEKQDTYEIRPRKKRGFILSFVVTFIYLLSFCVSAGIIVWGLYRLRFPFLSPIIFIVFVSLIAFAGAKMRERAKELHVMDEKEGLLSIIVDFFALPLVRVGRWLSGKWQRYNFISMLFTALFDMPFSLFIEFLEQWRYFLREKKEQIH